MSNQSESCLACIISGVCICNDIKQSDNKTLIFLELNGGIWECNFPFDVERLFEDPRAYINEIQPRIEAGDYTIRRVI